MAYIEFKGVSRVYKTGKEEIYANDEVHFAIDKGEFVVILGPSGAGKSTTLNLLGLMDKPTSGEIWIDGQEISSLRSSKFTKFRRDNIGFVFQFYNLFPYLTAKENVEMGATIAKVKNQAKYYMEQVDLQDRLDHFPSQLSGGEQQRVSIARALVKEPKLLLCDEPTGALDTHTGIQVLKVLKNQNQDKGTTIVLVTHNSAIAQMADKIIHIKNGKVESIELQDQPLEIDQIEW